MVHTATRVEHVDVLIVGAGISGIGAAYYLQKEHPGRSYAILEARGATGGTWDLFRYPGIRSDSDLHTFGYEFKPWRDEDAIASADKILAYLRETVAENGIDAKIRFHHKVLGAAWSSDDARWTVDVERFGAADDTEELVQFSANWIFCAGGYYRYDQGYTPEFPGRDRFRGQVVHPQHWPEDLDYTDKKVVVIGSGATAVTLVPAMAGTAAHVTMLQRSPTYVLPVPSKDTFANVAQKVLGSKRGYALARRKNIFKQRAVYQFSQKYPGAARRLIRHLNAKELPDGLSGRRALQPDLQPVGSAAVRGARCRPVQGDQQRCRFGGHRSHRDLHRDRHPAGVRQASRRRHHRHRNRFERPVARRYVPDRGRHARARR